jgi:hypothetical protein
MRITTLFYTPELLLFNVALTHPPPCSNVLKPPMLRAPDVTFHPTLTNGVDVTWANISLRFAYTPVSDTGSLP